MSVLSGWALARGRDLGRQPLATHAGGNLGTTATADTAGAARVSGATGMRGATVDRMTTRQLFVACPANCLRQGGGALLSAATMNRQQPRLHFTSMPLQPRRTPQIHHLRVRLHITSATNSGRCAQLNRTIPIATAPYAV